MQHRHKQFEISGGPPHLKPATDRCPRTANRFIVFSPKAKRRLSLFGLDQLHMWLQLEANPAVRQLCERPLVIQGSNRQRVVDFWVSDSDQNKYILISPCPSKPDAKCEQRFPAFVAWAKEVGAEVQDAYLGEKTAEQQIWRSNWTTILQQLSSYSPYISEGLTKQIKSDVLRKTSINELLQHHAKTDPEIVRAAIYTLVHRGELTFISIEKQQLSNHTEVEPK